jgi:hypothetical protein
MPSSLPSKLFAAVLCGAMLVGLPLIGVAARGGDFAPYLEWPPVTRHVVHAGYNGRIFVLIGLLDLAMLTGLIFLFRQSRKGAQASLPKAGFPFPAWGWWALALTFLGWLLAWTRFAWFAPLQEHTFCIPWIGYILFINALCRMRSGRSLMSDAPRRFLLLFPASATFWWFFEYLNRFVQNWYYVNARDFSPASYTVLASLAFSTVLPAVLSTYRLLLTWPSFNPGLSNVLPLPLPRGRLSAAIGLIATSMILALIGIYPDYLFPVVWVAPLLIITGFQALAGRPTLFFRLRSGDWRAIVAAAAAALICGFLWEMWNSLSLARWVYAVPFVNRFHLFAMPLLGYGGYLPFGMECLVIGLAILGPQALTPEGQAAS